jgi:putative transposase
VLQRPLEPKQYTSIAFTERLAAAGVDASVGAVGDALDNALAESLNGTFKAELIHRCGPWKTRSQAEIAIYEWIAWYNHTRLHTSLGGIPPAEYEATHYAALTTPTPAGAR